MIAKIVSTQPEVQKEHFSFTNISAVITELGLDFSVSPLIKNM